VETGLLAGYRFESYDASKTSTIVSFNDYKNFGGPLIVTKRIFRGWRSHANCHIHTGEL
jgi:hypothetical protein